MAYGYQNFQNYYQPMMDNLSQYRQQPPSQGIVWVQGEEGAKAYMVSAGNSVLLMDSETSSFYIKSTDQSGMPMPLRVFDYTERQPAPKQPAVPAEYVTRKEFEEFIASIRKETPNGEPTV